MNFLAKLIIKNVQPFKVHKNSIRNHTTTPLYFLFHKGYHKYFPFESHNKMADNGAALADETD